jgi:hypothetical protein
VIHARESRAGDSVRCPSCGRSVDVPGTPSAAAVARVATPRDAPSTASGAAAAGSERARVSVPAKDHTGARVVWLVLVGVVLILWFAVRYRAFECQPCGGQGYRTSIRRSLTAADENGASRILGVPSGERSDF